MKRIIVIGCPGSGKSTFARALQRKLNIPLQHLDMIYWRADGSFISKEELKDRLLEIMANDEWIIDGNYGSTIELRLRACDTVVFLDYPLQVCLDGIRRRKGKPRSDMPWTEKEGEEDLEFIEFIKNYNAESRPAVMQLLEKYKDKDISIFSCRDEADEFLKKINR